MKLREAYKILKEEAQFATDIRCGKIKENDFETITNEIAQEQHRATIKDALVTMDVATRAISSFLYALSFKPK